MAKGKSLSILLIICALLLTSCTKELREGDGVPFKKEIAFKATKIEAIVTKAGDVATENAKERESEKFIFLGVIGNDSLFLSAVETSATASHDLESLTKSNDSQVPQQMHIAAFKDNSTAPYANVTITSTDGWNTYSPVMYWPEFYETVHFFASSPNEGNSLFVPSYTTGNAGYSTQLSYSVPVSEEEQTGNDAIAQTDLIYAIAPNKNETQSGAVELYFSHLLSAVIFNIPTTIGDAAVSDAKIELNNIISAGDCTVSYSENGNNISWDIPDSPSRETYTQKINDGETTFPDGESFKLIPQILSESNATFTIYFKVGNAEHSYSGDLNALTDEWKFNRRYTYTITKREEVKVNVQANMTESNNQPLLKDVKILNTGFTTSYIRAAIVGYWYVNETIEEDGTNIEIESIASAWEIDDTSTGTIRYSSNWSEKWEKGNDGFYYHLQPVKPGEYTSTLFEDYVLLRTTGPVTGSQLKIHIAVQAIEASEASLKWPELTTGN